MPASGCASPSPPCSAAWPPPASPICWWPGRRARSPPRALAAHPPAGALTLGVRPRLLLTWGLTSAVPMLGVVLLFLDPSNPRGPGPRRRRLPGRRRAARRRPGDPAHRPGGRASRCATCGTPSAGWAAANYDVEVVVDDAGEIGLLQEGVNTHGGRARRAGAAARPVRPARRDVGRAARRCAPGCRLGGEERTVAALFVDIAGSTSLVRRTGPEEMVGLLNRFFEVVVETVEAEGGLVNKFEGDAALCVFGAPTEHPDPAGAALRAARRICDAVRDAGEVDVGVGVACGRVWAGQVGAASRLEYTVIGDPVNEAARLTELAKDHRPAGPSPARRRSRRPPRTSARTGCATARSSCAAAASRRPTWVRPSC